MTVTKYPFLNWLCISSFLRRVLSSVTSMTFTGLDYMSNTAGLQLFTGLDFMSNTAGLQFSTQTIERKKDLDTCFGNTDLNFGQAQTYGGVTPFKFAFIDVLLRVCRIFPTGHQDTFSYEECVLSPFLLLL